MRLTSFFPGLASGPGAGRIVWLCGALSGTWASHLIKIDVESGSLQTIQDERTNAGALAPTEQAIWLNDHELLRVSGRDLMRMTVGPPYPDGTYHKLVFQLSTHLNGMGVLPLNGDFLVTGPDAVQINGKTLQPVRLGPGVKLENYPPQSQYDYLVSERLGLTLFFHPDQCALYRISLDRSHSLPIHASIESLPKSSNLLPVEQWNTFTTFNRQEGTTRFQSAVNGQITVDCFSSAPPADKTQDLISLIQRLQTYPEERQRAQVNAEQLQHVRVLNRQIQQSGPKIPAGESQRLLGLYSAWNEAADGDAKQKAAEPILEFSAMIGAQAVAARSQFAEGLHATLTDAQLRVLSYDAPGQSLHFPLPSDGGPQQ